MNYWLVKSDPKEYGWEDLVKEKEAMWDGVRNYQARNNLKEMKKGDLVFVYESQGPREIRGIAEVAKAAYQDPTTKDDRWVAVTLKVKKALKKPISLQEIKAETSLKHMKLVNQSRLSVMPVTRQEWEAILKLSR